MNYYFCDECEMVIKEKDVLEEEEFLGEAWGRPVWDGYNTYLACPKCGEPVRPFYGEVELENVYRNSFDKSDILILGRDEDD